MKQNGLAKRAMHCSIAAIAFSISFIPMQGVQSVLPVSLPSYDVAMVEGEAVPLPSFKPFDVALVDVPIPLSKPDTDEDTKAESKKISFPFYSFRGIDLFGKSKKKYAVGGVLSAENSKLYAQIFDLEAQGDVSGSDALIVKLTDTRLMGHVLYRRYMHSSYNSTYQELRDWMAAYADHPNAEDIYHLALSRKGDGALNKPENGRVLAQIKNPNIRYAKYYKASQSKTSAQKRVYDRLVKDVSKRVRSGALTEALGMFDASSELKFIDQVERDRVQTIIAKGYLYRGSIGTARKLAEESSARSGKFLPEAAWIAGLSLWQKGDYINAARYFEVTGTSDYASGWLASAGSYWAGRSYGKMNNVKKRDAAYKNAAAHSRTFYGLLAARALGKSPDFDWSVPEYNAQYESQILVYKAGERALSLASAGQYDLAGAELMRLPYKQDNNLRRAVLAYVSRVGLPGVALRLGARVSDKNGRHYDSAFYPLSPWRPKGGYKIDPALIHAVIRQESRFDLDAKSYSGAMGLMQVMPETSQYVAEKFGYADQIHDGALRDPEQNLRIGQDYIEYLLNGKYVRGNMIDLLIAYNAGPGNLLKWRKGIEGSDDPLLFIEMLPVHETREYVERVLSNYWVYQHRAGQELTGLAMLAEGHAPQYAQVQIQDNYKIAAK